LFIGASGTGASPVCRSNPEVSTDGLSTPDGLMGDTGGPLPKPEPQPWANWSSTWKPAE